MYKHALNIGTLAGILSFSLFLILYYMGLSPLGAYKIIGMPIPILAIVWSILKTRNQTLGGNITLMRGFLVGSVTTLIWCTFKGFCIYIFMTAFQQDVIDQYIQFLQDYVDSAKNAGHGDAVSIIDVEQRRQEATPAYLMFSDITDNLVYGSTVGFIIALILRRTPKT